jgi:hypothetical protein
MFEKIKHAVERATKPSAHRSEEDAEITRAMWDYRIKQLRGRFGGCVLYSTEYITEAEKPAIEEKKRLETERQGAMIYKDSDTDLSLHINFNE